MALYQCITKCFHNGVLYSPGDLANFGDDYPKKTPIVKKDENNNDAVVDPGGYLVHFVLIDGGKPSVKEKTPVPEDIVTDVKVKVNNKAKR